MREGRKGDCRHFVLGQRGFVGNIYSCYFFSSASEVPSSACTGADVRSQQMPPRLIAEVPQWRVCSARVLYAVPRFSRIWKWCWRTRCPWERDVITRVKSVWLWTMSPQHLLRSRGADFWSHSWSQTWWGENGQENSPLRLQVLRYGPPADSRYCSSYSFFSSSLFLAQCV